MGRVRPRRPLSLPPLHYVSHRPPRRRTTPAPALPAAAAASPGDLSVCCAFERRREAAAPWRSWAAFCACWACSCAGRRAPCRRLPTPPPPRSPSSVRRSGGTRGRGRVSALGAARCRASAGACLLANTQVQGVGQELSQDTLWIECLCLLTFK